jgi:c-di-GMP phosphodiesterase
MIWLRAACGRLKEAGFMIALDDFLPNDPRAPLIELADIIKVDIRQVPAAEQAAMIKRYVACTLYSGRA